MPASKSSPFAPVRRRSMEEEVYLRMREAILQGDLPGGERLVQEDIAQRFGTSRIPVRDALRRLDADGLVEAGARGVYSVTRFGPDDLKEVYALRELLEGHLAAHACEHLGAEALDELEQLQEEMEHAQANQDAEAYVALNQRFHRALYDAAAQPRTEKIILSLWQGIPPLTPLTIEHRMEESSREHRAIIAALRAGDSAGAGQAMRAHIATAGRALLDHVARGEVNLR
ncbi:GntR family transcriptional regulator [Alloalcanivorax sp. C16-2]|uniref:GntR family transcriptional regulator n=1 Tax=Alloalcanivorax TaxID=3020832 RepID=UPI001931EB5A|nr:GntR family transcriptional regulator [Alloalcanivorax marinus]MBL7249911.1 GntR family transcriptional regulator [Alloalcanivorax marinus]